MKAIILISSKSHNMVKSKLKWTLLKHFCHFVWLIELPIATYNILQENIDLTLSLSVNLSYVVIVWVWCKTNKGLNWPIWQELLVANNGPTSPTKECQQWSVTSMWPAETIFKPFETLKCDVSAMCYGACKTKWERTTFSFSIRNE